MLNITCEQCNGEYRVPDNARGKAAKCPNCGSRILIPEDQQQTGGAEIEMPVEPEVAAPSEMLANRTIAGQPCDICNTEIALGESLHHCDECRRYYHASCWDANRGCASNGCTNAPLPELAVAGPPDLPGMGVATDKKTCRFCGERIAKAAMKCPFCKEYLRGSGALPMRTTTCGTATASMILGILSLLCFGIVLGPIAIGLAVSAKNKINSSRGSLSGGGMATAGLVLGVIGTAGALLLLVAGIA